MGRKCCVTNCNGNYDKDTKVATFRLPQDAAEKERWIKAIPRDKIPDSNVSYWTKNYATSKYRGKDRPIDPPSIFKCFKPSLVPIPPAFPRQTKRTHAEERNILPDEIEIFNEKDKITSVLSLKQNIKLQKFIVDAMINICENDIFIQSKEFLPNTCVNIYMLSIKNSFKI